MASATLRVNTSRPAAAAARPAFRPPLASLPPRQARAIITARRSGLKPQPMESLDLLARAQPAEGGQHFRLAEDAVGSRQIFDQRASFFRRQRRTPPHHLVHLSGPPFGPQSLLTNEIDTVARGTPRVENLRTGLRCKGECCTPGTIGKVFSEVFHQRPLVGVIHPRSPRDHLVDFAQPAFARESLLHDQLRSVTLEASAARDVGTVSGWKRFGCAVGFDRLRHDTDGCQHAGGCEREENSSRRAVQGVGPTLTRT